jgi:serine/threonine protein kinase
VTARAGFPGPGDRLGAYRILRRIGMGGMGMVFAATHEGLDREVALKVITPNLAGDESFRARFTREARALAALDSPHVVHVYDHGEQDSHLYIATQLVAGGDLGTMLQARGAPPVRTAVDLVAQVASGLADAHAAGIIHRDIKPANVLLRETPERITAYLGDFGIARQVGAEHTTTSRTIGTPSYMAPEMHTGGAPGVASDVYSLGCLLWATLTGKVPYAGTSDYQIVKGHLESPVPQLPGAGPLVTEVNRILRAAMAKEPAVRPASAAALRDDLRRALSMRDEPAASLPPEPRRRRPVLLAVGGVVLLAVLAGGAWLLLGDTDESPPPSADRSASTAGASPTSADDEKAIATLTEMFVAEGFEADVAACAAEGWVEAVGVPRMVEAGLLNEDLEENTVDAGGDPDPEVVAAGTAATTACMSR